MVKVLLEWRFVYVMNNSLLLFCESGVLFDICFEKCIVLFFEVDKFWFIGVLMWIDGV